MTSSQTSTAEASCWERQYSLAVGAYNRRWSGGDWSYWEGLGGGGSVGGGLGHRVAMEVRRLNLERLERVPGMQCPFGPAMGGCELAFKGQ